MASGLKHIKDHIKSISNIQKITSSMKMISATKFLKAEQNLINARPLGLAALYLYEMNPLMFDESKAKIHLCPITSDRGLCGSMPTRVCKYTRFTLKEKKDVHVICLGEKTRLNFAFDLKHLICLVVNGIGHKIPTFLDASLIAQRLLSDVDFAYGRIIFGRYVNVVAFEVQEIPLYSYPMIFGSRELDRYENEDDTNWYFEFSMAALIFYSLSENYVVELSCRMHAMNSASRNAKDLGKKLKLQYNRLRQSAVTRELIDIVSGAQVVASK